MEVMPVEAILEAMIKFIKSAADEGDAGTSREVPTKRKRMPKKKEQEAEAEGDAVEDEEKAEAPTKETQKPRGRKKK